MRLSGSLEEEQERSHRLQDELKLFKWKFQVKHQEVAILNIKLKESFHNLDHLRNFVASMRENASVLWKMADFNQNMRRRCQHELNLKLSELDNQSNEIFGMEQARQLYMMKYQVLEEQFTLLFNSIESISNAKNLEDKYDLQIDQLHEQITE